MELLIVTGMSGAGKTQVTETLEDLGYYCIDNMPPTLLTKFLDLILTTEKSHYKFAVVMDVRSDQHFGNLDETIDDLRERSVPTKIIFLEASEEVLMKRYNETKRAHPVTKKAVTLADIRKERMSLEGTRNKADIIIDTSKMKAYKLRNTIIEILEKGGTKKTFMLNIMSFGFKHGMPISTDMMYDVRFLPNPYYEASLKNHTGNSIRVQNFVKKAPEYEKFFNTIVETIEFIVPAYMREGKYHLNISLGCTGGKHRSVTVANALEDYFKDKELNTTLEHRDIRKK